MKTTARLIALMAVLSTPTVIAEDWPGIYGPRRDHTSDQIGSRTLTPAPTPSRPFCSGKLLVRGQKELKVLQVAQ